MKKVYIIFVLMLFVFSCKKEQPTLSNENEPFVLQGEAYGSTYSIIYYSYGENLNDGILKIIDEFDKSVNTYIPDSYLTKFNTNETGHKADKMLLRLVDISKEYNIQSNGFFDPSVEPLSELWGFSNKKTTKLPTESQVDSVLQFIGLNHVISTPDSLYKKDPRFKLSFNSITGFVNDRIADYLNKNKVESYMIEIGGEVYAKGKKPDQTYWRVGIDEPQENETQREVNAIVNLKNEGLATSGNYRKYHVNEATGKKIVHTINPMTGTAHSSNLLSATVIAPNTAEADAMATATMAMGYNLALEFIKQNPDLKFYLIWVDDKNQIQHQGFNGFTYETID